MPTNRLEAFSDGVLAIIITIMVLELKVPEGHTLHELWRTTGVGLLSYVLSFAYVGIYWNNHHHVFQLVERVSGTVLWANLTLLFTLSLLPFTTKWAAEQHAVEHNWERVPVQVYAVNLLLAGLAYYLLEIAIGRMPEEGERYHAAVGFDPKGILSMVGYLAAVGLAFVDPWIGLIPTVLVALIWFVPDRRIERFLEDERARRHTSSPA